jgi:hypothetical protein
MRNLQIHTSLLWERYIPLQSSSYFYLKEGVTAQFRSHFKAIGLGISTDGRNGMPEQLQKRVFMRLRNKIVSPRLLYYEILPLSIALTGDCGWIKKSPE